MTKARIQPFCRAYNINLGYYNEDRVFLGVLQIEIVLCIYIITTFV